MVNTFEVGLKWPALIPGVFSAGFFFERARLTT